jgi:hypothetical protein
LQDLAVGENVTYSYGIVDDEAGLRDYGFFANIQALVLNMQLDRDEEGMDEVKYILYDRYSNKLMRELAKLRVEF